MPVDLLIAPPASGKTLTCIQRIRSLRATQSMANIWVIVPDRLQAAVFRRRLAASGGAINVQIARFNDLFSAILERSGEFFPMVSHPLRHRLVQDLLDDAIRTGQISYYTPLEQYPGFIQLLSEIFAQLKQAFITPDQFSTSTRNSTITHQELSRLFTLYQAKLSDLNWIDTDDLPFLAESIMQHNPESASFIDLLIIDGFDSFNRSQIELLELLSQQVKQMLITLPGIINSQRIAHQRFIPTVDELIKKLTPNLLPGELSPHLPDPSQHIEKYLFDLKLPETITSQEPFMIEARSPADETREALRWIKKCVIREKISLSDCAIFTPKPELYNPILRSSAEEFGIPVSFTVDSPLQKSPAITSLMNLLALPIENFRSRQLINVLRSPYFDFSLNPETVDLFEKVSRVTKVIEGQDQWQEIWKELTESTLTDSGELDEERRLPELPRKEEAIYLGKQMQFVFEVITPPNEHLDLTGWIEWLEVLLHKVRFDKNADDQDKTALSTFRDMLRALILTEQIVGSTSMHYTEFLAQLKSTLPGVGLHEVTSFAQPTVMIGRMIEARGSRFKAVAILGLAEGSFPNKERPDPFLDEDLRQKAGLESRLQREQAGLFYQAVTRSDKMLLLTRPYLSENGDEVEKSAYWKAVEKLFAKGSATKKINPDIAQETVNAASTQELLFSAVINRGLPKKFSFLLEQWQYLQHADRILKARSGKHPEGEYEGLLAITSPETKPEFSANQIFSASRLETYGKCPFQYFVNYILKLEEPELPTPGFNAAQRGSILHEIFEKTYRYATDRQNEESLLKSLNEISDAVFLEAPKKYVFRPSALWEFEKKELLQKIEESIRALSTHTEWQPIGFEESFGRDGNNPLAIQLEDRMIKVRGKIDRIDQNEQGEVRVIDYKSGGSGLDQKSFEKGTVLQLPIYALAARDTLKLGNPVEGFYWIVNNDARRSSLHFCETDKKESKSLDGMIQILLNHLHEFTTGILSGRFPPQSPDGGCNYCPASLWCWRFVKGRK